MLTDYYIALGVNYLGHVDFPQKQFFWCSGENLKFTQLPAPKMGNKKQFDAMQTMFTGEFDKVINFGITEIDRLSYVVH